MRFRELLMSVAAIAVLVALIALTDDRVRERIRDVDTQTVSSRVVTESARMGSVTSTARDLALENGVLSAVVVAGAILFVAMLRT